MELQKLGHVPAFKGTTSAGFFKEKLVDGVVLLAPSPGQDAELDELFATGFPIVQVGSHLGKGYAADYVDVDNREAARLATELLLQAGHQRILFIGGPEDMTSARDREKASPGRPW